MGLRVLFVLKALPPRLSRFRAMQPTLLGSARILLRAVLAVPPLSISVIPTATRRPRPLLHHARAFPAPLAPRINIIHERKFNATLQ
jgi:hypothetical protein